MRYVIAVLGGILIFVAVFVLALLTTNWSFALARLERDGLIALMRENIPALLLGGLAGMLSFAGTLRYYREKARSSPDRGSK